MHLEKHLLLDHYFLNLLGFMEFDELREALKDQQEGFDKDGRSYFLGVLAGRGALSIPGPTLARYDSAIREYVLKLRRNRRQPDFNLKYFQYLAVLFTEIFLDELFNNRKRFLSELNEFVKTFNSQNDLEIEQYSSDE